jgi:hypothetical protein
MDARGFITISMHELERVKLIEAVVEHRLRFVQVADRLHLCERQLSRLGDWRRDGACLRLTKAWLVVSARDGTRPVP